MRKKLLLGFQLVNEILTLEKNGSFNDKFFFFIFIFFQFYLFFNIGNYRTNTVYKKKIAIKANDVSTLVQKPKNRT